MRPTRNPLYESAWAEFDRLTKNYGSSVGNLNARPHKRYNSRYCFYCKKGWGKDRKRTRQHLLPKRRGGLYETENLRWCCHLCNQLLASVDDCPVIYEVSKTLISETPLKQIPLRMAFAIYIAMRDNNCNKTLVYLIKDFIAQLKDKKKKYVARKVLLYIKKVFPGTIRTNLPKEE